MTPVIANLRNAVTNLLPVMHELRPTAAGGAAHLFDDLPPFLRVADLLLGSLKLFSASAGWPAVPSIEAPARPGRSGARVPEAVLQRSSGGLVENFGDALQKENGTGDYIGRCVCVFSAESYSGLTPTEQKLVQALVKAGGLSGIANPTANPLRRPGSLPAADQPFTGTYQRIEPLPAPRLRP